MTQFKRSERVRENSDSLGKWLLCSSVNTLGCIRVSQTISMHICMFLSSFPTCFASQIDSLTVWTLRSNYERPSTMPTLIMNTPSLEIVYGKEPIRTVLLLHQYLGLESLMLLEYCILEILNPYLFRPWNLPCRLPNTKYGRRIKHALIGWQYPQPVDKKVGARYWCCHCARPVIIGPSDQGIQEV